MKKFDVKKMVILSSFSAIAAVLYCFLKFNIPIFPSFLEFNFSLIPIIIAIYMYGCFEGIIVALLRFIFKIILVGTHTSYVGELADLLIAIIVIFAVWLPYFLIKDRLGIKKKTFVSIISGVFFWCLGAIIINWFVLVPFYKGVYGIEALIGACSIAIKGINESNFIYYYLLFGVLPFNLILSSIVLGISSIVYFNTYKYFSNIDNS